MGSGPVTTSNKNKLKIDSLEALIVFLEWIWEEYGYKQHGYNL